MPLLARLENVTIVIQKNNASKRVLVALSGGVDSSAAVCLLQEQGYQAEGMVLCLSPAHESTVEDAKLSAEALGIPLHIVREEALFTREVITPWAELYRAGKTPNPCILCNPAVKFALLAQTADKLGIHWLATGHYAGVKPTPEGTLLLKAGFLPRDQSYMLHRLPQAVLSRMIFPLNQLSKEEVRAIAAGRRLACAQKPDSQEICFIPDNDYIGFLERNCGTMEPGEFISPEGQVCGRHQGIFRYTVGQRKGLGIALGRPVFVKRIDPQTNRIYLADAGQEYARAIVTEQCRWVLPAFAKPCFECGVKIRSMAKEVPARITLLEGGCFRAEFLEPQRAPAPGQSAVLYQGDMVLGGGFITEVFE